MPMPKVPERRFPYDNNPSGRRGKRGGKGKPKVERVVFGRVQDEVLPGW